jgi:hypothetical protein
MTCLGRTKKRKLVIVMTHMDRLTLKMQKKPFIDSLDAAHEELVLICVRCQKIDNHHQYSIEHDLSQLGGFGDDINTAQPSASFVAFARQVITKYKPHTTELCSDANLGDKGGSYVTEELHYIAENIKPRSLLLFTNTPTCVEDAKNYLHHRLAGNNSQLIKPACVKYGFACSGAEMMVNVRNHDMRVQKLRTAWKFSQFFDKPIYIVQPIQSQAIVDAVAEEPAARSLFRAQLNDQEEHLEGTYIQRMI